MIIVTWIAFALLLFSWFVRRPHFYIPWLAGTQIYTVALASQHRWGYAAFFATLMYLTILGELLKWKWTLPTTWRHK